MTWAPLAIESHPKDPGCLLLSATSPKLLICEQNLSDTDGASGAALFQDGTLREVRTRGWQALTLASA